MILQALIVEAAKAKNILRRTRREIIFQAADDGIECQKEEWITKEEFFEDFLNMTGVSFYDMKSVDLILWDEE